MDGHDSLLKRGRRLRSPAFAHADRLTQSILAKAFRGELVPTEATLTPAASRPYESAEELLARIQSKRPVQRTKHRLVGHPRSKR